MPTFLGISVGTSGVNSVLRTDTSTGGTIESRRIAAELGTDRDLGDLVFDAISLTLPGNDLRSPGRRSPDTPTPQNITVAYRTEEQAAVIRSVAERKGIALRLVPETSAVLAYLHTVGVRREPGSIALVDIGASGTAVSVLDQETGTVLRSARTDSVSGAELAARVYEHVRNATAALRVHRQIDPELLAARCQGAQDLLTTARSTRIDIAEAGPDVSVTLSRAELDDMSADLARTAADFARQVCTSSTPAPRTLALVGGGSASTALADAVAEAFDGDVVRVPDPGAAAAAGAAVLGDTDTSRFPLVGLHGRGGAGSGRISGTVAGVLVLSAVFAGFATQHFTERDNGYAPVSPLLTSGAAPTERSSEPSGPTSATPDSVSSFTRGSDPGAPTTSVAPPANPPSWTTTTPTTTPTSDPVDSQPSTTVTPTPIDQVPTLGRSAEDAPDTRPQWPGAPARPDSPSSPQDDRGAPPDTVEPDPSSPEPSTPDTTTPDTTVPDTTTPPPGDGNGDGDNPALPDDTDSETPTPPPPTTTDGTPVPEPSDDPPASDGPTTSDETATTPAESSTTGDSAPTG